MPHQISYLFCCCCMYATHILQQIERNCTQIKDEKNQLSSKPYQKRNRKKKKSLSLPRISSEDGETQQRIKGERIKREREREREERYRRKRERSYFVRLLSLQHPSCTPKVDLSKSKFHSSTC